MENRRRYTIDEVKSDYFYQMPKFLFGEEFKGISNDARVLYTLLRDRHNLSIKNHWINDKDEVYITYTRDNMLEMLNVSKPTVTKVVNELKAFGLIEEERRGLGKPNRIYLLHVISYTEPSEDPEKYEESQDEKTFNSAIKFFASMDLRETTPSNNNINNKNKNLRQSCQSYLKSTSAQPVIKPDLKEDMTRTDTKPNSSVHYGQKKEVPLIPRPSQSHREARRTSNNLTDYNITLELLKENIEYNFWKFENGSYIDQVDEILLIMLDVILTQSPTITISGEVKPRALISNTLMKLNHMDIEHVINQFKSQYHKISNKRGYLLKCLYNCKMEFNGHYTNLVNFNIQQNAQKSELDKDLKYSG